MNQTDGVSTTPKSVPPLDASASIGSLAASSTALTTLIACIAIMAICAFAYYVMRTYREERRFKRGARMCKCLAPSASVAECGNVCQYTERCTTSVAVQTMGPGQGGMEPATSWMTSDVRVSEARRTGCPYSSPKVSNEAAPNLRAPASGSSNRCSIDKMQQGSVRQVQEQRQHRRRSRPTGVASKPSINVQSASSSTDSYSCLTNSRTAVKDLTAVAFTDDEDEDSRLALRHGMRGNVRHMESHYVSPYHPRFNSPVSDVNDQLPRHDDLTEEIEEMENGGKLQDDGQGDDENEQQQQEEDLTGDQVDDVELGHHRRSSDDDVSSGRHRPAADGSAGAAGGVGGCEGNGTRSGERDGHPNSNTNYRGEGRTQSLTSSISIAQLKRCHAVSQINTAISSLPVETVRFGPSVFVDKSFETLPGGRLISRWTQTVDTTSLTSRQSLDWDAYEIERLRAESDRLNDIDNARMDDEFDEFDMSEDLGLSSTTLLATRNDGPLPATRNHQLSGSSPYSLCYDCNENFSFNDDRRMSRIGGPGGFMAGQRRNSTSSPNAHCLHQLSPPSPLSPPTPSSCQGCSTHCPPQCANSRGRRQQYPSRPNRKHKSRCRK